MDKPATDTVFSGPIPELYETLLVPLIFEPYAVDLVDRLVESRPARVLEVAAGTGVVTRRMASQLPASAAIVATDLNQAMLDHAASVGTARPVQWRQADAMQLPFDDGLVRRRRLPVRRHVLSRQGQGVRGGASRARARRRLPLQRLGPDRGQRVRRR